MDEKVWTQAIKDTLGLEAFHEKNRNNYMWDERVAAIIVSCDSTVDAKLVKKKAAKISSGKWNVMTLNKKFCSSDSIPCVELQYLKLEEGQNDRVDALNKTKGSGEIYAEEGRNNFVILTDVLPPSPKELNETRGQVTSDYQDELEVIWMKELRSKYEVIVNKELLSGIKQ